jgi:hypothetical protein
MNGSAYEPVVGNLDVRAGQLTYSFTGARERNCGPAAALTARGESMANPRREDDREAGANTKQKHRQEMKLVALVSLGLWFGVGAGGRWIGFSG